jgi:hypothetical protein
MFSSIKKRKKCNCGCNKCNEVKPFTTEYNPILLEVQEKNRLDFGITGLERPAPKKNTSPIDSGSDIDKQFSRY